MVIAVIAALALQQPVDSAYTATIRELTTEPRFNTELAYRLAVEDTSFIRQIRDSVITLITPVTEVLGQWRPRTMGLRFHQPNG